MVPDNGGERLLGFGEHRFVAGFATVLHARDAEVVVRGRHHLELGILCDDGFKCGDRAFELAELRLADAQIELRFGSERVVGIFLEKRIPLVDCQIIVNIGRLRFGDCFVLRIDGGAVLFDRRIGRFLRHGERHECRCYEKRRGNRAHETGQK